MKTLKCLAALPLMLSLAGIAHAAKGDIFYTVPFHNVEVKAAAKIYVNYNFDPTREVLTCQQEVDNDAITSVEWIYKGATRKVGLPVTLKDNPNFKGYDADPAGKLVITNDFGSQMHGSIYVTCQHQTMK